MEEVTQLMGQTFIKLLGRWTRQYAEHEVYGFSDIVQVFSLRAFRDHITEPPF
jgi:hypothetical protein